MKIFNKLIISAAFITCTVALQAQTLAVMNDSIAAIRKPLTGIQKISTVFTDMPDSILPSLTKYNRKDCIDFLESNMRAVVKNRFSKEVEMKKLTKDYILFQSSESSSFEMKLLPLNDSTQVICMIKNACAPICDSDILFYDINWNKLSTSRFFTKPSLDDFIKLEGMPEEIRNSIDIELYGAHADSLSTRLKISFNTLDFIDKEAADKIKPYIKSNPIEYRWEGGHFLKQE